MKLKKYYCFAVVCVVILPLLCYGQIVYAAPFLSKDNHTKKVIPIQQKKDNQAVHQYNKKNKKSRLKAEADQSAVWSNAFTFQKVWGTQIDPRTGIFSAWLQVGSLVSNMNRGPNINLNVNYSTSSLANPDGLGIGWSWNLTHFNPSNNQLTTSQGQSFQLRKVDRDHWWPRYHKLKDILINGSKKNNFVITYANALRETLNHEGYETRLEQQDGRGVNFKYLPGTHLLSRIMDDSGHKISLTYNDNYINITSYSVDGSPVTIQINRINRRIRTVSFPVTNITDYKTVNLDYRGFLLYKIIYPTGLIKTMNYNCNGAMKLSTNGTQTRAICVVTRTNVRPGFGQPEMITRYSYDSTNANHHNYLAYNSGLSFLQNSGQDILFRVLGHYTYKTITDNGIVKELRTFNKYHLLIDTKTISDNDNHLLAETQNFFCRTDVSDGCAQTTFDQLPATYDRPLKIVTTIWSNHPGESPLITTVVKRYDDQGRLLMSKDSYGHEEQMTYCTSDNNTNISGCPQEPADWSVVSLLHSATASVPGSGLPAISRYINYHKFSNISGKGYMLTESSEDSYAGEHHVSITRQYYNDPDDPFTYGLLKKTSFYQNLTTNSKDGPVIRYYYYHINANRSVETHYSEVVLDVETDKRLPSSFVSTSLFTNQVVNESNAEGKNSSHYFYDLIGHVTRIDLATGTAFATSKHYDYTISPTLNQLVITVGNGLKRKIIFDSMGRKLKRFDETISDTGKANNEWRITHSKTYDSHGRIAAEYSYLPYRSNTDAASDAVYKIIPLITKYDYDNRGRMITAYLPDGEKMVRQYDDGNLCSISYEQDSDGHYSPVAVIRTNKLGKPVKQIVLPAMENPLATTLCTMQAEKIPEAQVLVKTWDRYGRLISTTDPAGKVITNRYDALGHVTDTINSAGDRVHNVYNIHDQIVEKWVYPADSSEGYLLSSAAYDAAGRLLWETGEDGKKTHYTYKTDGQIATKTTSTGHIISWQYNVTGLPIHEWLDGKTISQIDYDHITVLPIKKQDITGTTTYAYSDDGKLQQINRSGKNGYPDYHLQWHYNLARQVISSPDISGNTVVTEYDQLGRAENVFYKMKNGNEETLYRFVYDGFSRTNKIYYGSRTEGAKDSIRTIKYDKLGRQSDVTDFTEPDKDHNEQLFFEQKYTYDVDNNIMQIIENGRASQHAILQYKYDQRNNLISMSCTGSAGLPLCPRDTAFAGADIKEAPVIVSQHYTFNHLNRMQQVTEQLRDAQQHHSLNKVMTYTYGDAKAPLRLQQVSTAWNNKTPVTRDLSYDDSGNMIIDEEGNHVTYNIFNQITSVLTPNGKQQQYSYDGSGRKARETSPTGNITYLLYMNKTLLGEQTGRPGAMHMISYLGVAKAVDGVINEFYGKNYRGDVITVMHKIASAKNDHNRSLYALKQYNVYSPYGMKWYKNATESPSSYQQTLEGFNGTRTDPLTGWQFLGAGNRTYSSAQRYFLSEDSAGDGYAFGGNNPIMHNDPDGNMPKWVGITFNILNKISSFGLPDSKKGRIIKATLWVAAMALICGVSIAVGVYKGTMTAGLLLADLGSTAGFSALTIASAIKPHNKGLNIATAITGGLAFVVPMGGCLASLLSDLCGTEGVFADTVEEAVAKELKTIIPNKVMSRSGRFGLFGLYGERTLLIKGYSPIFKLWKSLYESDTLKGAIDNDIKNLLISAKITRTKVSLKSFRELISLKLRVLNGTAAESEYSVFYDSMMSRLFGELKYSRDGIDLTNAVPDSYRSVMIASGGKDGAFSGVLTSDNDGRYPTFWYMYLTDGSSMWCENTSLRLLPVKEFFNAGGGFKVYSFRDLGRHAYKNWLF